MGCSLQLLDSATAGIMRKPDKHFGDYRSQTPLRNYTPRAPLAYLCAYPKLNPLQIKREKGRFFGSFQVEAAHC